MAGVLGFEPRYAGIKTLCLTAWRHPYMWINLILRAKILAVRPCDLLRILQCFYADVNFKKANIYEFLKLLFILFL